MSTVWSPADLYISDKKFAQNGNALRDMQLKWARIKHVHIPSIRLHIKEKYPELSFLFNDFEMLYMKYKDNTFAKKFFDSIEAVLRKEEAKLDENPQVRHEHRQIKVNADETSITDITTAWFFGELSPNNKESENDSLFREYIINRISNQKKQSKTYNNSTNNYKI